MMKSKSILEKREVKINGGFIIPAIDVIEGKCVRLTKGDYSRKKIYNEDPLEVALQFEDAGLRRLHLVDLDGARAGEVRNWKILERIAGKTNLIIDFSGGISSQKNVEIIFNSGASFASVGSITIRDEMAFTDWLLHFGTGKFIIGADVHEENIIIRGWTEKTPVSVFELIGRYKAKGIQQFFCTDTIKDGMLEGVSAGFYRNILSKHPSIDLIASGGVSAIKDIADLREAGCKGVIIGKAIYENKISLNALMRFC